jgi:predicted deacylase
VDEQQVQRCLRVVNNFGKVIGVIRGRLEKGDDPVLFSDETRSTEVKAPVTGLFVARDYQLCDPVRKGAILGHILSDIDLKRHDIISPATGYLKAYNASRAHCDVALPSQHPYVDKGDRLATVTSKR